MKMMLLTAGTRGDVEPFFALARAARDRGHQVRIAIPDNSGADSAGLDTVGLSIDFAELISDQGVSPRAAASAFRTVIRPAVGRLRPPSITAVRVRSTPWRGPASRLWWCRSSLTSRSGERSCTGGASDRNRSRTGRPPRAGWRAPLARQEAAAARQRGQGSASAKRMGPASRLVSWKASPPHKAGSHAFRPPRKRWPDGAGRGRMNRRTRPRPERCRAGGSRSRPAGSGHARA